MPTFERKHLLIVKNEMNLSSISSKGSPAFPQKVNRVAMGPSRPAARPAPKRVDNIRLHKGLHTNSRTAQMTVKQNGHRQAMVYNSALKTWCRVREAGQKSPHVV